MELDINNHPLTTLKLLASKLPIRNFRLITYKVENDNYGVQFRDKQTVLVPASEIVTKGLAVMAEAEADGLDVVVDSRVDSGTGIKHPPSLTSPSRAGVNPMRLHFRRPLLTSSRPSRA